MSSVHQVKSQAMKRGRRKTSSNNNNNNNNKKSVKVVYISTPMKVNISASNFRALVQELTGRDSDMSRFDDHKFNFDSSEKSWEHEDDSCGQVTVSNNSTDYENNDNVIMRPMISSNYLINDHTTDYVNNYEDAIRPVIHEFQSAATAMMDDPSYDYSPTSSESLLDSFDDVVSSQIVEELEQMFPSNLFGYESCISHDSHGLGDVYGVV